MEPPPGNVPTQRSSIIELSTGNAGDPSVTGNEDLDMWIWIIEYLAKFETGLSLVHDVFESVPELPDHLGDGTDEVVALRCLASLFDSSTPESSNGVVSGGEAKVEFDSSESCEYVLQCILDEIPLSELKPGAPGLSKWNLVPFIKSKILCLPKCTLELIRVSSHKKYMYTGVSPCHGTETTRNEREESDQITARLADQDTMGRVVDGRSNCQDLEHGDEYAYESEDVISKSHTLSKRINEAQDSKGFPNESGTPVGHVSSPSEPIYKCRQCKNSGKLLFCSSENCAFMVHARCIDSLPTYDDAGNYYCPLCVYNSTSSEYLQCQAELPKAKKKLGLFLQLISKVNKKISIAGSRNGDPTTNL